MIPPALVLQYNKGEHMRRGFLALTALVLFALPLSAQTADEIVAKYVKAIGGMDKINALKTIQRSGKFTGGGGFEARLTQENKRPNMVREDFFIQGMDGVNAYDGKDAWKISPFGGRKDPEKTSADEAKALLEDAEIDGPLIDWKAKGSTVEYLGMEDVDGTPAHKLRVVRKNGDINYVYLDPDAFLEIRIITQRMQNGAQVENETDLGDYEKINGVFFPFSIEGGPKGSTDKQKIIFEKAEANTPVDDTTFKFPTTVSK